MNLAHTTGRWSRSRRRVNYGWRLIATAMCFTSFSLGALLVSLLIFTPMLAIRDRRRRRKLARWVIHKACQTFIWEMELLGIMRLHVTGLEHLRSLRGGALVLANHPTLVDVVALVSLIPNASCVTKADLFSNPFLGGVVRSADYVRNAGPEDLLANCARDLAHGDPLIIFPEGTRSRLGEPLHFLRGASYIALYSSCPILPVVLTCQPATLTKQHRWYQIPARRFDLRVNILPPENIAAWTDMPDASPIAARRLTHALQDYFTRELECHG